jgi:hypothetical protein
MPIVGCTDLRIGTSVAALQYLRDRGIEAPDDWLFRPYSVVRTDGTGLPKGYGFPTCAWVWEVLDQSSLNVFLAFFSADTDAGAEVTISTYTERGRGRTTTDYTAIMHRPVDGEDKTLFPDSGGNVWQNVTIQFTHLEAA